MEAMIQQLKKQVIDQDSYYDCVSKRLKSAMRECETEEQCNECVRLEKLVSAEYSKLVDLRHSLYYLRRAAGHKDVDAFNPERF